MLRARARSFPPTACALRFVKQETKTRVFPIHADHPFRAAEVPSFGRVDAVTLKAEELEGIYRTARDLSGKCC